MHENLLKLLACTGKSSKQFWNLVRSWTDDKPVKPRVTIDQLHNSFKARLNPPAEIPDSFDGNLHEIATALNDTIPGRTQDRTPQRFFSRKITVADIQQIKKKLRKKTSRRSSGIDEVTYAKIMTIPNEALVKLFQTYRLVGMECGLLQMYTMLLDERLREWGDANDFIPDSQNGFRPNRRTDDNSFILLCAIQHARAEGKTLYVFFGDITNAFPYTDVARLWTDMYAAGVSGPMFDMMQ
ncbi:hypothetical protein B0H19DRAFT_950219 [Mycena capillaripes]|nr:hypothetical protein B0H19DRAFT_950219 [Mycena capillaripes]